MPLAKTASPKSPYDYDQEGRGGDNANELKSQDAADRKLKANMKALRLLDQSQVKSKKEADRKYNSNMAALKLLDEVAIGESFKPQPAVPDMDLSPKPYSDHEEVEEGDDILAEDDFKRYKTGTAVAREQWYNKEALKLLDQSFGGEANKKCKLVQPSGGLSFGAAAGTLARAASPKSAHDSDQEGRGVHVNEFKSHDTADRELKANMKALRLLDQSQVKSKKEADRNYSSNMEALKLLDEVARGESFKPRPAVPDTDLSPKPYSGQEDIEEGDDILVVDECKRYKSGNAVAREQWYTNEALKLMDQSFGGEASKKCKLVKPTGGLSMRAAATEKYAKEKEQKYRAMAMVKEAKKHQKETRPKKLTRDKTLEEMATTTRKKKVRPEDVRDPDTVAGMKCEYDYQLEKSAEKKALQLVNCESLVSHTDIV